MSALNLELIYDETRERGFPLQGPTMGSVAAVSHAHVPHERPLGQAGLALCRGSPGHGVEAGWRGQSEPLSFL